jgi:hypothetical protein
MNVVCAILVLAVLVPVVYVGDQWIECRVQHLLGHPSRREPFENWSLR